MPLWALGLLAGAAPAPAGEESLTGLVASLSVVRHVVPVGEPILIDCLLANTGTEPIALKVPGTTAEEGANSPAGR